MVMRNRRISEKMESEVDKGAKNLRLSGRMQPGAFFFKTH